MTVNYQTKAGRPTLARFGRKLGSWDGKVTAIVATTLLVAGISLLLSGYGFGWSLVGIGAVAAQLDTWYRWYLKDLPVADGVKSSSVLLLQDVLDADLMVRLQEHNKISAVWAAASATWQGIFLLNHIGLSAKTIAPLLDDGLDTEEVWSLAKELADSSSHGRVNGAAVIAATIIKSMVAEPLLSAVHIDHDDILDIVQWLGRIEDSLVSLSKRRHFGGVGRDWASGYTPMLNNYGTNISRQLEAGGYHHYLPQSREQTLDQVVNHLSGGNRTGVVLLGSPGIGKTTAVTMLADRLIHAETGSQLRYYQIVVLSAATIVASGKSLEQTLLTLFGEAIHAGNIILFMDEAQLFFGSGVGSIDVSQILLPILQQSNLKLIMAMAPNDWQRISSTHTALVSLYSPITLKEPSDSESMDIMQDAAVGLEHKTNTIMCYQAIREAYKLAGRYLPDEALPGKAIKLLEEAAHYPEDGLLVAASSVQKVVEDITGTKLSAVGLQEKDQLLNMEDAIHKQMVNQSRAVSVVANALRRSRSGVANPSRPVGSFLFLGPTGVGKTELAKAVANSYFGGQKHMVRLDMSEYQEAGDVKRLLQATPEGSAGTNLISAIRKQPFSLVLLDEVEKAHPDILNVLLQLLDEGQVTDSAGRVVSFKDCIIIATSNAAADDIRKRVAAGENLEEFETEIVNQIIESHQFRQELLNRFDEIVLFRPLTKPELLQVVDLLLTEVNGTLAAQKISVGLTAEAKQWLVDSGYDVRFGARPMRRAVQRAVEDTVAKRILEGKVVPGQTVHLDVADIKL